MKGFLTKRPNGMLCLTWHKPLVLPLGTTDREDVFPVGGDPLIWCSPICDFAREHLFHVEDLDPFETAPIVFAGYQTGSRLKLQKG